MRYAVTGAAGFIGSQLAGTLLEQGHEVLGIDCLTSVYSTALKEQNLAPLHDYAGFEFTDVDLRDGELTGVVAERDAVFHLAAIAGVRASWARGFRDYVENNILATQRVLEAVRQTTRPRVVYASSSSVYGKAVRELTHEDDTKRPHSPYGVSKLSGEHLCETYADAFGLEIVALRYFSVYGPRQRPDMAVHRIIEAGLTGSTFDLYGSGKQVRDMTFVSDVVEASLRAAEPHVPSGTVCNVAGGAMVSLREIIDMVQELSGRHVPTRRMPTQPGDVERTGADPVRSRDALGWHPQIGLRDGIRRQIEWHESAHPGSV